MRTATPTLEVSVISPYIGQERQGGTVMKRNKNQQRLTQTPKRKKKNCGVYISWNWPLSRDPKGEVHWLAIS